MSAQAIGQRPIRLGILVSHPIQYFSPWFRELAAVLDLRVLYIHRQSDHDQSRAGFGIAFDWDTPLLDGYEHIWLDNAARTPGVDRFLGCDVPDIEATIRRERLDALLVFGWRHLSSWQALRACRRLGIPVLMKGDSGLHQPGSLFKRLLKRWPYRLLLPLFDAHLYIGTENKRYLQHYGVASDRLFFSPLTVDQKWFSDAALQAERDGRASRIRRELGISKHSFVYLFVGKFTRRKRAEDFLRGFLELYDNPDAPEIDAVLVGDGPLRTQLEGLRERLPSKIHIAGFRNQSDLPSHYAMADVLVLPGDDPWGLVVNEAAACGVPAIVSDGVGCAADLIVRGKTGAVFAKGEIRELARCMLALQHAIMNDANRIASALAETCARYNQEAATAGLLAALQATLHAKDDPHRFFVPASDGPTTEMSPTPMSGSIDGKSRA